MNSVDPLTRAVPRNSNNRPTRPRTPPPPPSPLFGVEIEIYIKVKPKLAASIKEKQRTNPGSLPAYWRGWDFDLKNNIDDLATTLKQRQQICKCVEGIIESALGPGNGWTCHWDSSLKEQWLTLGPEPRKWWGVEITSPPMSASKQWQLEIEMVFNELGKKFDFWTDTCCACHVHVSPGPNKDHAYTLDQLVRVANGAFFWDYALQDLISPERHWNEFAMSNHRVFASRECAAVPNNGWGPVFDAIEQASQGRFAQKDFIEAMQGGAARNPRLTATNFAPVDRIGTVELRIQAGAASAMTTIHRILVALTLHVSARRYIFDEARSRTDYPRGAELIKELAGCIKKLPSTCHGSRFVNFLKWSLESYANGRGFTEAQINAREDALRNGLEPPKQTSYKRSAELPPPGAMEYVPPIRAGNAVPQGQGGQGQASASASTPTRPSAASREPPPPGSRQGRAPAPQGSTRAPAPQGGNSSSSGRGGGTSGASSTRGGGASGGTSSRGGANTSSGPTRGGGTSGGGGTTRLPERPAQPSSSSRTQGGGSSNTNSNSAAAAAAAARPVQRRRRAEGEGNP